MRARRRCPGKGGWLFIDRAAALIFEGGRAHNPTAELLNYAVILRRGKRAAF